MPPLTTAVLLALTICSTVVLIYWCAVLVHFALTARQVPTARDGLRVAAPATTPRVCAVIPAHNEEAVIGELARSLAAQDYPRDRTAFLFALDRCTDRTRAIIEDVFKGDPRLEIVEITECPRDWTGKVNAMWTGLKRSRLAAGADLLLFADADTTFDPACTRATVALLGSRGLDMLSLLSTQRSGTWFERLVQPSACLELVRQYPLRRANSHTHRRPFANGQFILFRRDAYDRIGGHEPVKDEPLEDVHIARLAHAHGLRLGLFLADGMLHCRMYRDWAGFRRGWKRIFIEAANRKVSRLRRFGWRIRIIAAALPLLAAAGAVGGGILWLRAQPGEEGLAPIACILGAAGAAAYLVAILLICRASRTPLLAAPLFPVGAWITGGLMRAAAADLASDRPMLWGGRTYHRARR